MSRRHVFFRTRFPGGVSTPNLTGVGLGHECGYIFQNSLKEFMEASANIHSTVKLNKWDGMNYKIRITVDNKRRMLSAEGIAF